MGLGRELFSPPIQEPGALIGAGVNQVGRRHLAFGSLVARTRCIARVATVWSYLVVAVPARPPHTFVTGSVT